MSGGANQDAVLTAKSYNIAPQSALTYSANAVAARNSFQSLSNYTRSFRATGQAAYTTGDRTAAMEEDKTNASVTGTNKTSGN